jgi:aspartyl-tRNA(Asn)/glutamyl-tRNA(Gln) amidotransferase subunit C
MCGFEALSGEKARTAAKACENRVLGLQLRLKRGALRAKGRATQKRRDPMSIDKDTAAKVAKLARIRVEAADLPALAEEFNAVLGFIEQLSEVDVEGVEPMVSVTPMRLPRRVDVVSDGGQQAKVLANAPDAREGFFAVPKVVE